MCCYVLADCTTIWTNTEWYLCICQSIHRRGRYMIHVEHKTITANAQSQQHRQPSIFHTLHCIKCPKDS